MSQPMTRAQMFAFIQEAPRTGHLATVRANGRPHVAPIWIAVDPDREEIVFTTGSDTVKGRSLIQRQWAALCVDDQAPPFAFVIAEGPVTVVTDLAEIRRWATIIAGRYMGEALAETYGARNGVEGEWLCRLAPVRMVGERRVAD
jgi:PPOX class probable F420-dependent enzyme